VHCYELRDISTCHDPRRPGSRHRCAASREAAVPGLDDLDIVVDHVRTPIPLAGANASTTAQPFDPLLELVIAEVLDADRRRVLFAAVPDRLPGSPEPLVKNTLSGSRSSGGRGLADRMIDANVLLASTPYARANSSTLRSSSDFRLRPPGLPLCPGWKVIACFALLSMCLM